MTPRKIAFIGNSCTGKTTCAVAALRVLKLNRIGTGYVNDVARSIPFDPMLLDDNPDARLYVLFRQIEAECAMLVRADAEIIVCERSVMDWYAYYEWTLRKLGRPMSLSIRELVRNWASSYDTLILLPTADAPYHKDGFRPEDETLRLGMGAFYEYLPNWVKAARYVDTCVGALSQRVDRVERIVFARYCQERTL